MSANTGANPPDPGQEIVLRTGFPARLDTQAHPDDSHHRRPPPRAFLGRATLSAGTRTPPAAGVISVPPPVRGRERVDRRRCPPDQVVQISYQAPKSVLVAILPGKLTVEADRQP